MDYLITEAAQCRYVIAAHFLRECSHVIEIGGFKTPITQYLTGTHESVTVYDPLMQDRTENHLNGQRCQVRYISESFQDAKLEVGSGTYGLIMLGLSLKHFSDDPEQAEQQWSKLISMVTSAKLAVIEAALDWHLGKQALDKISTVPQLHQRVSLDIDMSANPNMDPDHFRRRLLVLEPR